MSLASIFAAVISRLAALIFSVNGLQLYKASPAELTTQSAFSFHPQLKEKSIWRLLKPGIELYNQEDSHFP